METEIKNTIVPKKIIYSGKNLPKHVQSLYAENYKMLMKDALFFLMAEESAVISPFSFLILAMCAFAIYFWLIWTEVYQYH